MTKNCCLSILALFALLSLSVLSCQNREGVVTQKVPVSPLQADKKGSQIKGSADNTATKAADNTPTNAPIEQVKSSQESHPDNTSKSGEAPKEPLPQAPSPLTPEEQKLVHKIGDDALYTPQAFGSSKEATRYLKALLKGDHRTIHLYKGYENLPDSKKKEEYGYSMESALNAISVGKSTEGFNLAVRVLKTKRDYPPAMAAAANVIKNAQDPSVIPLLRDVAKESESHVRLESAHSLLILGDIDTALPLLDDLTKDGYTAALGYVFHNMEGKEWEAKGLNSIKRAWYYDNKESKALAGLFLIRLKKKGKIREDLSKLEKMFLDMLRETLAKKKWMSPTKDSFYSDRRAMETTISALIELKSRNAVPLLKNLQEHPEASYLKRRAGEAIKEIDSSQGGKS